MESEKKRKRAASDEVSGGGGRRNKEREMVVGEKATETAAPPPKEEEVEEFFAILRRMQVAVKYFEKNGVDGVGRKLTGWWGTALETEVLRGIDGVKVGQKLVHGMEENCVLDLNATPEAESNSSA